MPRRRRVARGRRQFRVTLDVLCVVANGAEAWEDHWGDDADAAWLALRDELGHAGADDWRTALNVDDEVDPRDPEGRTVRETVREYWSQHDEQEEEPWQR